MKVISVFRVLEFSNSLVWENPFTALHVHCTTPETAFEYLSDLIEYFYHSRLLLYEKLISL